jgi:hypothetical protein
MIAQTAEVREQHQFDVGALERYLRERVPGFAGPLEVRQFRGGQPNRPTISPPAPANTSCAASHPARCCRTPWTASTA